jgi:hypothetical protein
MAQCRNPKPAKPDLNVTRILPPSSHLNASVMLSVIPMPLKHFPTRTDTEGVRKALERVYVNIDNIV